MSIVFKENQGLLDPDALTKQKIFATFWSLKSRLTRYRLTEAAAFSPSEGKAWDRMESAISEVFPEAVITPYLIIAGSDAKHLHTVRYNVLRFSPIRFTLEEVRLIHNANKRICKESVAQNIEFYIRLMK